MPRARRISLGRRRPTAVALALAVGLGLGAGCKSSREVSRVPNGQNSRLQAEGYVKKAVRRSPEGFILLPSKKAERAYDRVRLGDLAQELRSPAAACFINRAIDTMRRGDDASDEPYLDVPEGQAKIRVRIAPSGEVLRTEILETGFSDEELEGCLMGVLQGARWPESRTTNTHWIDVIYWVSLGFQEEDRSAESAELLRRQTALAAVRARGCFTGRVPAGSYPVEGLSLLDREGRTLVNRIEPSGLPAEVAQCIALTFREIRMPRASEAFVRPFWPSAEFTVADDGTVGFVDERWLELVLLEEEAEREARRIELAGQAPAARPPTTEGLVDILEEERPDQPAAPPPAVAGAVADPAAEGEAPINMPGKTSTPTPPSGGTKRDPGKGGLKLNLGARPPG